MKVFGIPLRRPSFGELTAAAVMAVGLWLAAVGLIRTLPLAFDAADAGALLLVMLSGCICARLGIDVGRGSRHLAANLVIGAVLLGLYKAAWALAG